MGKKPLFIGVFVLLTLLVGCATQTNQSSPVTTPSPTTTTPSPTVSSPTPTASPSPVTPSPVSTVKTGWVLFERPDDGFSVALPKTWKALDLSLSQYASMKAQGFLFFASDPELNPATTRAPGSFSVARKPQGTPLTLDYLASVEKQSLEAAADTVKPVTVERVQLPFGEAVQMYYQKNMPRTGGQIETMVFLQYEFLTVTDRYMFTFETVPAITEKYLPIFEDIARSFRFLR